MQVRLPFLVVIDSITFYERRDRFCQTCQWWRGVCLKGHALGSPEGCPIQRFPPVEGAAYALNQQAQDQTPHIVKGCCGQSDDMPPLTWAQVLALFAKSMALWITEGLPLANSALHGARYDVCKRCKKFNRFYCKHCKCVAMLKTKLLTSRCPLEPPEWT